MADGDQLSDLYWRGVDTVLACWAEFAQATPGAAVEYVPSDAMCYGKTRMRRGKPGVI